MRIIRINQPYWVRLVLVLIAPIIYAIIVPIHYLEIIPENGSIYYFSIVTMMAFLITPIFLGILIIGRTVKLSNVQKVFYSIIYIYIIYGLILGGMNFRQHIHLQKYGHYRRVKAIEKQDRGYDYRLLFRCGSDSKSWIGNVIVDKKTYNSKYDKAIPLLISSKDPRIYQLVDPR